MPSNFSHLPYAQLSSPEVSSEWMRYFRQCVEEELKRTNTDLNRVDQNTAPIIEEFNDIPTPAGASFYSITAADGTIYVQISCSEAVTGYELTTTTVSGTRKQIMYAESNATTARGYFEFPSLEPVYMWARTVNKGTWAEARSSWTQYSASASLQFTNILTDTITSKTGAVPNFNEKRFNIYGTPALEYRDGSRIHHSSDYFVQGYWTKSVVAMGTHGVRVRFQNKGPTTTSPLTYTGFLFMIPDTAMTGIEADYDGENCYFMGFKKVGGVVNAVIAKYTLKAPADPFNVPYYMGVDTELAVSADLVVAGYCDGDGYGAFEFRVEDNTFYIYAGTDYADLVATATDTTYLFGSARSGIGLWKSDQSWIDDEVPLTIDHVNFITGSSSDSVDPGLIQIERGGTGNDSFDNGEFISYDSTVDRLVSSGYSASSFAPSPHDILSTHHGDTTAAAVVRGDLVTGQGATPKWTRFAKGNAYEILAMNGAGTDPLWTTRATLMGTGTDNYIPKFLTGATPTFTNSLMSDNGTTVSLTQTSTVANQVMFTVAPFAAYPNWIPLIFSTGDTTNYGDFTFSCNCGTFSGERDPYMFWGYNVLPSGLARNTNNNQATIYYGIEGNYAAGVTNHVLETYIQYYSNDGLTTRRPFTIGVYRETNLVDVNFKASNFYYRDLADTLYWQVQGANWFINGNQVMKFSVNNYYGLAQINAAGTTYVNLIKLDASNRLVLGEDFVPSLYNIVTYGCMNLFRPANSGTEAYAANVSRTGFGNTAGHSESIIWGYNATDTTLFGKIQGVVTATGMDFVLCSYDTGTSSCTEKFRSASRGVIINELGSDFDTRIEGDNDANLLFCDAGNDRVGIGLAAPLAKLDVVGISRFGDSTTNYATFAADGELNLVGTARVKKEVRIESIRTELGSSAPSETTRAVGASGGVLLPVLQFSQVTQQDCYFTIPTPSDMDTSVAANFHLMWQPGTAWTTGNYMWKLEYLVLNENGATLLAGTPTTISADVTPSNATTNIETVFSSTITLAVDQYVVCHFYRDVANDNADAVGSVTYFELNYTVNKLGVAT